MIDLSALRALCEQATPGPWRTYRCSSVDYDNETASACGIDGPPNKHGHDARICYDASYDECHHVMSRADADLIAAARTALPALIDEVSRLRGEVERMERDKDGAYDERNRCVAAMAYMAVGLGWRAGLGRHDPNDAAWDREWLNIVYIDTPNGQASWHIHDRDVPLFGGLPRYDSQWDGHSTSEKYARLEQLRTTTISTARKGEP
jgi:hypothetical protein